MESIYNRVKVGNVWKFDRVEEGQGKRTAHLTPPFYARPWKDGKQRWYRPAIQTLEWGTGRKSEGEVAEASRLFAEEVLQPRGAIQRAQGRDSFIVAVPGKEKRLRSLLGTAVFSR